MTRFALAVGLVAMFLGISAVKAEDSRVLAVGSGDVLGMSYPEAGAVCRLVNKDRARHGLHCLVEPTSGSAANLAGLQNGDLQLAIVQSRVLAQAVQSGGSLAKTIPGDLRALLSLHGEALVVVVGPGAKIRSAADLKGKRLNLGHPGSFQRSMAEALLVAEGIGVADLSSALEMDPDKVAKALCHNEIDAAVFTGLHPMPEIQEAIDGCGADLLPLKDAAVDRFLKANPAYTRQLIAEDVYTGTKEKLPTFGVRSVLVTTARLPDDKAYEVVKAVFDNLPAFKGMHPLLKELGNRQMARDALVAPLHDGAQRYYRENGLP